MIKNKPEFGVKEKREDPSSPLTIEDFNNLLNGLREDKKYQWELYARISFVTALRSGDVLSLKWEDILNKDKLVFVERKRRKMRNITFSKSVQEKISELYELLGKPNKELPIMTNNSTYKRTGKAIAYTQQYINRKLKTFKLKYNLEIPINKFQTHSFRKTFGKYVFESKGKSYEALALLNVIYNHSSIQQTQTYIGLTDEKIQDIYGEINF